MADSIFPTLVSKDANPNATSDPIYVQLTDGTSALTTTSGALSVNVSNTSLTVTQATGTNLHTVVDSLPALPAGTNVIGHVITDTGSTTVVTGTVAANISQYGGVSTSLGQKVMASSIPVTFASDQSALTLSSGIGAQTGAVCDYATATVTANSTSNHDYTVVTNMKVSEVSFACSGGGKVELKVGPVASLVSKWVGFIPTQGGEVKMVFTPPIVVPTTSTGTVRLVMTNRQNQSQDLYSTIVGVDA